MLNHIVIMGRLTRDPEYRATPSGLSVANFSVAVDRDFPGASGEKETDFVDCIAWRKTAEFVVEYMRKGSMVVVSGRLQIRSWTDKDGNRRRTAEVVADNVYFGESKRSGSASATGGYPAPSGNSAAHTTTAVPASGFVPIEGPDESLPF